MFEFAYVNSLEYILGRIAESAIVIVLLLEATVIILHSASIILCKSDPERREHSWV